MMHTLNIGTLAVWLSVAGFGTVGMIVPDWGWVPSLKISEELGAEFDVPEVDLGDANWSSSDSLPATAAVSGETSQTRVSDPAPDIPAIPDTANQPPLPEIPDLPPRQTQEKAEGPSEWGTGNTVVQNPRKRSTHVGSQTGRKSPSTGPSGTAANGSGSDTNDSARLAAGRMPAPVYPAAARRAGQTGTVTVAFTVDASGRVISAHAVNPSPWPLLNEEAVRTVRRWKFPPGGVMKLQRPIVFQLR